MGSYLKVWKQSWSVITGCKEVSSGCLNCVARQSARKFPELHYLLTPRWTWNGRIRINEDAITAPRGFQRPNVLSCMSGDFFNPSIPPDAMRACFDTIEMTEHHFLLLTKRPEHAVAVINAEKRRRSAREWNRILDRLWVGVTVELQRYDDRLEVLRQVDVDHKWVSLSPLLGPMRLNGYINDLDWVYVGGESGTRARPMHPGWATDVLEECREAHIPFYLVSRGRWVNAEDAGDNPWRRGRPAACVVDHRGEAVELLRLSRRAQNHLPMLRGQTYLEVPPSIAPVLEKYRKRGRQKRGIEMDAEHRAVLSIIRKMDGMLSGAGVHRMLVGKPSAEERQLAESVGCKPRGLDLSYDRVNYVIGGFIDEGLVSREGSGKTQTLHVNGTTQEAQPAEDPELCELSDEFMRDASTLIENLDRFSIDAQRKLIGSVAACLRKVS
jgi:protein gp37